MEIDYKIQVAERLATIEANQKTHDGKLDKILSQVEKTNGRVTKLEQWQAVLKSNITLIAAIASALTSAIVTIILRVI